MQKQQKGTATGCDVGLHGSMQRAICACVTQDGGLSSNLGAISSPIDWPSMSPLVNWSMCPFELKKGGECREPGREGGREGASEGGLGLTPTLQQASLSKSFRDNAPFLRACARTKSHESCTVCSHPVLQQAAEWRRASGSGDRAFCSGGKFG